MNFDWKSLPYVLPLLFITLISIPGIIMVGGIFHEFLHSQDFETESVCMDYNNGSFMYISSAYINANNGNSSLNDDSLGVSRHFEIYQIEGFLMGILCVLVLLCFTLTSRFIVKKRRDIA